MKILVTGVNGQLGHDVVKELVARGIAARGVDIADFDLTDEAAVSAYVQTYQPDAIVHCAAYTAVDKAEEMPDLCYQVNVTGTKNIAKAAKAADAKLVYISTDYVFDGSGDAPHEVFGEKRPVGVYGETKHLGEEAAKKYTDKLFIVRTSWVFGKNGNNFVKTMLRLGAERPEISVVNDQIGSPTYTVDLARGLCDMLVTDRFGTYHMTNEGMCSWYDFTVEIMAQSGLPAKIKPVTTAEYNAKAKRPLNSRLSKKCLDENGFKRLPVWQDALKRYLEELKES